MGTGTVDVTVTTPSGTSATSAADQFTYVASSLPTVSGISPTSGPSAGGTAVHHRHQPGRGHRRQVRPRSPAPLTADTDHLDHRHLPGGDKDTVDVTVTTPSGTSATSAADQFTYVASSLPTVSGHQPHLRARAPGAPRWSITGTNLGGATAVKFGSVTGTVLTADTDHLDHRHLPGGDSRTVDVTVTTPSGTSATSAADQFTYVASSLPTALRRSAPTSGPSAGAPRWSSPAPTWAGPPPSSSARSPAPSPPTPTTSITVTSPAGTGTVDVTVTTPSGTSATSGTDRFSYASSGAAINSVGSFSSKVGTGLSTLAVSPQSVGDVLAVFAERSTTGTLTSVSGGGVTTWTKGVQFAGSVGADEEIWFGKVTTTGSSTITFTWSGTTSGFYEEYGAQEFTAGLGANTAWALDKGGTVNGASSTTVPFPSLTPSGPGSCTSATRFPSTWPAQGARRASPMT